MKETINNFRFHQVFKELRPTSFSSEALDILFNYLEQFEHDIGEEIEFDPIGFCCEYAESSPLQISIDYRIDTDNCDTDLEIESVVREYLDNQGALIGETYPGEDYNTFVYRQF